MHILKYFKNIVKKFLGDSYASKFKLFFIRFIYQNDLQKLALAFGTDKEGIHFYAKHYQQHFHGLRHKKMKVLEIGIGGYDCPKSGGNSLRMWAAYFYKSNVFGIDIYDKSCHNARRIKTFKGSQVDEKFIRNVMSEIGGCDIIIDDGSHNNDHVIKSFCILFPLMNKCGVYVVEDLQTSYWDEVAGTKWGGSSDLNASHTSVNFFKRLVDSLNYKEFVNENYEPTYFDKNIISIHFYHNLVFIYKGDNNEESNVILPTKLL